MITIILAFVLGWFVKHVDVKAAFLNGKIDNTVYVKFPQNIPNSLNTGKFFKLNKSLYGLKQAPLLWFKTLRNHLVQKMGYKQLDSDFAVFMKRDCNDDNFTIVPSYVDDLLFISNNEKMNETEINSFLGHFEGTQEPLKMVSRNEYFCPRWYITFVSVSKY